MSRRLALLVLVAAVAAGCFGDDDSADPTKTTTQAGPRLCDVYLDHLADPSAASAARVRDAAGDGSEIATADESAIDGLVRARCQSEWTAGTQGAGGTDAAAQAFLDALVAGDRFGARNVAAANAIAVFEPWEPVDEATSRVADVGSRTFTLELGVGRLATCEVDVGVVIACAPPDRP